MTDPRTTPVPDRVRSDVAHDARRHDGRPGQGDLGDRVTAPYPGIGEVARADRAFPGRAVGYPAGEAGIRRLLDSGTGLVDHTPEVARRTAPDCRVAFAGFLVEPGLVSRAHWRSEPGAARVAQYGAVARKP
ncbi:SAM-dependent methyltransferase [Streptomyces sp. NBC_01435]|uniref:SAM-dependent methyltransferase n=1 Tax=Streptomyces sp. NBC_01435 TaxID=2903865 RepID=UPI002E37373B|nr:SAM-dependent methyltransferase [Streptomyces sp. NBC_01435]